MKVRLARVTALAAFLGLPATAGSGLDASSRVNGTVSLAKFDLQQRCGAKPSGTAAKRIFVVSCSQIGYFSGKPASAGVSNAWTWDLEVGANGRTTGRGPETGKLGLNFGGGNIVYLATKGMQLPVGKATAVKSRAKTTGTSTVTNGSTGQYKNARGSGTYTFSTTFENGKSFTVAKLTLKGSTS